LLLSLMVVPAAVASATPSVSVTSTQVATEATITAGPTRSECFAPNFDDTGLAALQSAVTAFDAVTNSTVTCVTAYLNSATDWTDWESPWITQSQYGYTSWVAEEPQSRQLVLDVDLIPSSLENIDNPLSWEQSCAAGAFDNYATQLGTNLVAAGLGNSVLRLGAEMNGNWEVDFIGTTTQEQNLWASCFANEVTALRQVPGQDFLIDWDVNACKGGYPYANFYPGNSYVDILGLDLYDVDCDTPNTSVTFSQLENEPYGLAYFEAFAAAQGKPMSFPEWGLSTVPSGDDPAYINAMASVVANGDVAFESYFDGGGGTGSKSLALSSSTPLSLAAYQQWFGSPQSAISSTISGTVTAAGGSSQVGICAEAFLNGTQIAASATTGAGGAYQISGLAPGSYGVFFEPGCGGGDYASQWYNATNSGTQSAPGTSVTVSVASPATGINATMTSGTSISGTLRAAGGGDLSGICVTAYPVGGASIAGTTGTSASDGTYLIEGLLPGNYDVDFDGGSCGEGGAYAAQWFSGSAAGTANSADALAVATSVASPATSINAAMAVSANISGTVTAVVGGADLPNVCVSATSTDGGGGTSTVTSATGNYTLAGLAADSYAVVIDMTCGGTITTAYAVPQLPSGPIGITPGETATYNYGVVRPGSITDVVTPNTSAPTTAAVGGATYTPSATASSGDIVAITLDGTSTGCALTTGVVSFTAVGTCVIDFNDPRSGTSDAYTSAMQVQQAFSVAATSGGGGSSGGGGGGSSGGGGGGGSGGGSSGGASTSGGTTSGSGGGASGVATTSAPPPPPTTPLPVQLPIPRETTYGTGSSALSAKDKTVLSALAEKLTTGESLTITAFAYHDAALARQRALVVASYMKSLIKVPTTIVINTTSTVGKVIVTTHK
ncbi:MAG: glycosyl hydrolase, partial [Acidimicrobiales bacterium]